MVKSLMKFKILASCDAGRLYSFKVLACMALSTDFGNSVYEPTSEVSRCQIGLEQLSVYEQTKKNYSLTTLTLSSTTVLLK